MLTSKQKNLLNSISYEHPQPHACFIQSVADDLVNEGGIMDLGLERPDYSNMVLEQDPIFLN